MKELDTRVYETIVKLALEGIVGLSTMTVAELLLRRRVYSTYDQDVRKVVASLCRLREEGLVRDDPHPEQRGPRLWWIALNHLAVVLLRDV
jgi:hypothetical protein